MAVRAGRPLSRWPDPATILLWILAALVLAYLLGLLVVPPQALAGPLLTLWVGGAIQWLPVLVAVLAAVRTRFARPDVVLTASGLGLGALAYTYYTLGMDASGALPSPSPADIGYLALYPLMLAAIISLVHRQAGRLEGSAILDGMIAVLGVASVLSVLLAPVFEAALEGGLSPEALVRVAYPLSDLVLLAGVAGVLASRSSDLGARWVFLVAGIAAFVVADIVFALLEQAGRYTVGTALDALWGIGLALIAVWCDGLGRPARDHPGLRRRRPLLLPWIAVLAGLGVLGLGTRADLPGVSLVLAVLTLALAAVPLLSRQRVLRRESRTDDLTLLPNRRAFRDDAGARLVVAADGAGARSGRALMLMDLDRFKDVNDSLGHDVGDRLLVEVGARLAGVLGRDDLFARLGGDEFAVLLEDSDERQAVRTAQALREALAEPFELQGRMLHVDSSIGIALSPEHGTGLSQLMRRADLAMYEAKTRRSGQRVFRAADELRRADRLDLLQELRSALRADELVVHFQPKVSLSDGTVTGSEALVRWQHPSRGLLLPSVFLPLVEEAGLMGDLTEVVLHRVLDQAADWAGRGIVLPVAVNVSAGALSDPGMPARLEALLARRGVPVSALTLEITEDVLMIDADGARGVLADLRRTGIEVAIDDFGTGYSSLAYLRDLAVDELKLDRSFVPVLGDERAGILVSSIVELAHRLGLRTVAEGVEDQAALDLLAGLGCDEAQGYFISPALPAERLEEWLARRPVPTAPLTGAADRRR
jgi:diguanylate cyclase (GGDEF)-like protein